MPNIDLNLSTNVDGVPKKVVRLFERIRQAAPQFPSDLVQEAAELVVRNFYDTSNGATTIELIRILSPFPEQQEQIIEWFKKAGIDIRYTHGVSQPTWRIQLIDSHRQAEALRFAKNNHFEGGSTAIRLTESKILRLSFDEVIAGLIEETFPDRFIYMAAQRAVKTAYSQDDCSDVKKLLGYSYSNAFCHDALLDWLRHAGIYAEHLKSYGPTEWQVFILQRSYQKKALDFIKCTPFDNKVSRRASIRHDGYSRDDREREDCPGSSVRAVAGGGTGAGGKKRR